MPNHTMTTDAEGKPTFSCNGAPSDDCHVYPDCDCENYTPAHDAHKSVEHADCYLVGWYSHPIDSAAMYYPGDAHDAVPVPPNRAGEIIVDFEVCPLWSFAPEGAAA